MTEKLTQWEKGYQQGRKAAEAQVAELERELGRLRIKVPRLEVDLAEARHPGYQAWLASSECRRLTTCLHQATALLQEASDNLCEEGTMESPNVQAKIDAFLATLAGEDENGG